jgi:putative DNA primase/helicase
MRPLTDLGNAERFADQYANQYRYVATRDQWRYWTGKVWAVDATEQRFAAARLVARGIQLEAANAATVNAMDAIRKWGEASESLARQRAMVTLAQADRTIATTYQQFDADANMLNTQSGLVDLRCSVLHAHRPEDYCSRITRAAYVPGSTAPTWQRLVSWALCDDAELIAWFQRAVGASLYGHQQEQIFAFCFGGGGNGKGSILNALRRILGDYACILPGSFFELQKNKPHTTEIADLFGARFAVGSEVSPTATLDEGKVKELTGGDPVKARRLHENNEEHEPTWTLWLSGNSKPRIRGTDRGMWRRMRLIPFVAQIEDHQIDRELPNKLLAEADGILTWAIEGARLWHDDRLGLCSAVESASLEYREAEDVVGQFLEDCCLVDARAAYATTKAEFRRAFEVWCTENGLPILSTKTVADRLAKEGIRELKSNSTRSWRGVRLVTADKPVMRTRWEPE